MKKWTLKNWKKYATVFLVAILLVSLVVPLQIEASSKVKQRAKLSHGVNYEKLDYSKKNSKGTVDKIEIDVSDQFTEVQLGRAEPLDNLATVRKRANTYHKKNNNI